MVDGWWFGKGVACCVMRGGGDQDIRRSGSGDRDIRKSGHRGAVGAVSPDGSGSSAVLREGAS
jgi:hypothetical protein